MLICWLCWVFGALSGLFSSCGELLSSRGAQAPRRRAPALGAGSALAARGLSCSAARGILLDQGFNSRPLHWQADS